MHIKLAPIDRVQIPWNQKELIALVIQCSLMHDVSLIQCNFLDARSSEKKGERLFRIKA